MKIRVSHLAVGDTWGGAEEYLAELVRWLTHEPDFTVSVILLNEGRLAERIRQYSKDVFIVPESETTLLSSARRVAETLKRFPCDILHTHKPKDNVLGVLAGALSSSPLVVRTVHGSPEIFSGVRYLKMILHELPNQFCNMFLVDRVIAVSRDLELRLGAYYGAQKVLYIPNGIDCCHGDTPEDWNKLRLNLGVGESDYVIGCVGRLTAVKGQDFLIKATAPLLKARKSAKLVLIGEGPLRKKLETLALALGVSDNVVFAGHQEQARNMLRVIDLFVQPSLNEGMPLALLEAMAAGLPVIATRVGGIPEVIEDCVSGILVEPGDPDGLALMCRRLMHDAALAERLGQAARARVEERFSSRTMTAEVANVYRRLVGYQHGQAERHHHQNIQTGIMVG